MYIYIYEYKTNESYRTDTLEIDSVQKESPNPTRKNVHKCVQNPKSNQVFMI